MSVSPDRTNFEGTSALLFEHNRSLTEEFIFAVVDYNPATLKVGFGEIQRARLGPENTGFQAF